jgi:putative heme transporter
MPRRMHERPTVIAAERTRRLIILGGLWLFILAVLFAFRAVVLPFAAAALIAYLVAPLVDRLTRIRMGPRTMPRWVAIILIYIAFFGAVYLAFIALVPQLYRELARISRDAVEWSNSLTPERIREMSRELEHWLNERGLPVEISSRSIQGSDVPSPLLTDPTPGPLSLSVDLEHALHNFAVQASTFLRDNFGNIVDVSRKVVAAILAGIFMTFFMLMVAAFFSIDATKIRRYVGTLVPPEYATDVKTLVQMIDRKLAGVVRGQVTICIVNGTLTFIGLMILGVKFAFLLATIALLFSLIPIFGTILSSLPIVLIGLSQSWQTAVGALLWIVGIHALEAYFLNPKIMGTAARIHPIVVAFALIAGEQTYGLIGALFAVPLAGILAACFDFFRLKAQPDGAELALAVAEAPATPPISERPARSPTPSERPR